MSRWLSSMPSPQVPYFAACELIYRRLMAPGAAAATVGDHFEILSGYAFKSANYVSNGVRLLRNVNVKPHRIDWADSVRITSSEAQAFKRFALQVGDLVMSMDGTINKQGLKISFLSSHDVPALLLQRVCRFDPVGTVTTTFLYHMLHATDFFDHLDESNRSIAIPHVSAQQLKAFRIPVPSPDVQIAICTFLSSVERGLGASERAPLPGDLSPLSRIVERFEAIARKIEEARRLRGEVEAASDNLCRSILSHATTVNHVPMGSLVRLRPSDIRVQPNQVYQFAGVYSFGRGVFRSVRKSGSEFSYERLTALRAGDFVYPKLMAWEGALGVVPPECDGCAVSPEFPTFEVDQSRVLPEVLDVHFRTPAVWPDIAALSTGTNVRRRRVHPSAFMTYMFPLPDMATQQRMVGVRHALNRVAAVGASLSTELDAMLPAVLEKAFRGAV